MRIERVIITIIQLSTVFIISFWSMQAAFGIFLFIIGIFTLVTDQNFSNMMKSLHYLNNKQDK